MRTRRTVSVALATVGVIVATASVLHATVDQYRSRPLNRQNVGHISGHRQTSSTNWTDVGGWSFSDGMVIDARGSVAATLSVTVSGAPVEFRVAMEVLDQGGEIRAMKPTSAHFDPAGGTGSFSYTFVAGVGPGHYSINLLWRSPTGGLTQMDDGSLVVQYGARSG